MDKLMKEACVIGLISTIRQDISDLEYQIGISRRPKSKEDVLKDIENVRKKISKTESLYKDLYFNEED